MATVGNLFVNVGASTRGLEQGLKRGQDAVRKFGRDTQAAAANIASAIPGVGSVFSKMETVAGLGKSIATMWDSFNGGAKEAAARTEAIKKAEQDLASLKGTRKNIGMARSMLAAEGIDPNKAAKALAIVDTSPMQEKVARSTKMVEEAQRSLNAAQLASKDATSAKLATDLARARETLTKTTAAAAHEQARLAGAQLFADKAAKGRDPYTGRMLNAQKASDVQLKAQKELQAQTARTAAAVAEHAQAQAVVNSLMSSGVPIQGAKDLEQAEQRLLQATKAQTEAQKQLGAARQANQRKEALRGKLNAMGIDLSKGQGALNLSSLGAAQEKLRMLREEAKAAADGFKIFGLSIGKAIGPVGLLAAGLTAAVGGALLLTKSVAKSMDSLRDSATAAGMSAESFQDLNNTYHELGVAEGIAETASQRLGIKLEEAVSGAEDAQKAFARLGMDYGAIAAMSPDQALNATISRIRELGSHRERIYALRELFGKSGVGLAAAVNATNEEFREASERAAKLRVPEAMVSDLARINDKVEGAFKAFKKVGVYLASAFGPALEGLADSVFEMFTADPKALLGGMQSIAMVLAVIYDLVAGIVNLFMAAWNLVQMLAGLLVSGIMGALGGILKAVEGIMYGMEWLTGASHDMSNALGETATTALNAAAEAASAAGKDGAEMVKRLQDAFTADATMGVADGIARSMEQAKKTVEGGSPIMLQAEVDQKSLDKIDKELQSLRNKVREASIGGDAADLEGFKAMGANTSQIAEYEGLQKQLAALEQSKAAHETIADLNDQIAKATMTTAQWAEYEAVTKKGLTLEDAKQVALLTEQLAIVEKQAQAREQVTSTITDLQAKVDQLGMSEMEILRLKMQQNGATAEQIAQAEQLQAILDEAKTDSALKSHFDALETRLLEAQGAEEEILRRQLENMGLAGDALNDALTKTMEIETAITEAERMKANQEDIASTLKGLEDQLFEKQFGKIAAMQKSMREKGATEADIARATALQEALDSADGAKGAAAKGGEDAVEGIAESIDTAFGSMKLAGVVSASDKIAADSLHEAEAHTGLLESIAASTALMAVTNGGEPELVAGSTSANAAMTKQPVGLQDTEDGLRLLKTSNEYLKEIARNTGAFAGALT